MWVNCKVWVPRWKEILISKPIFSPYTLLVTKNCHICLFLYVHIYSHISIHFSKLNKLNSFYQYFKWGTALEISGRRSTFFFLLKIWYFCSQVVVKVYCKLKKFLTCQIGNNIWRSYYPLFSGSLFFFFFLQNLIVDFVTRCYNFFFFLNRFLLFPRNCYFYIELF